ncbi:MAG: transposase family protein [Archaeoglobaceae archaeon]
MREHLPLPERVRKKKISSFEDLLEEMPEIELLIDATEQERQRPKEKGKRKRYYSGRKRQTIKSQIVVERGKGLILDVSSGWYGSIHDLKVFERSGVVRKFGCFKVKGRTDKGYVGGDCEGMGDRATKEEAEGEGVK